MMLTSRFEEALVYAAQIHAAQRRKGTDIPYVSHLLGVASLALEHGAGEDEAIAALLHDAAEDQGGQARLDDIRERFGEGVAHIVEGCSDSIRTSDDEQKRPWPERKAKHLAHLRTACPSVRLVSAADKLHNARAMLCDQRTRGEAMWARFNAPRESQLRYLRGLVAAFGDHEPSALLREFALVVDEIERATD